MCVWPYVCPCVTVCLYVCPYVCPCVFRVFVRCVCAVCLCGVFVRVSVCITWSIITSLGSVGTEGLAVNSEEDRLPDENEVNKTRRVIC